MRWSREEFGDEAAPAVVRYYKAYFDAPARYASAEDGTISDVFEQWCARELLLRIIHKDETSPVRYDYLGANGTTAYAARVAAICREAEPRWQRACLLAEQAMARVPAGRRDFFQAHVLTQARLHLHATRMLAAVAEAASPELQDAAKFGKIDSAIVLPSRDPGGPARGRVWPMGRILHLGRLVRGHPADAAVGRGLPQPYRRPAAFARRTGDARRGRSHQSREYELRLHQDQGIPGRAEGQVLRVPGAELNVGGKG